MTIIRLKLAIYKSINTKMYYCFLQINEQYDILSMTFVSLNLRLFYRTSVNVYNKFRGRKQSKIIFILNS